jgi:hypothetical protein
MMETRAKVRLAFAVTFLLGVLAGALGLFAYARWGEMPQPSGWTRGFDRDRYVRQLREAVGLRPDQMRELDVILDEARDEFLAVRRRLRPEFDALRQRARQRIRGILTGEQHQRFEEFIGRWDEERLARERAAAGEKGYGKSP